MSTHLKHSLSSHNNLYADFLIHLEEQPTPETIKRLQQKIEELQEKVLEQAKQAKTKELELHRLYDEKKGKWVLRYLEAKVQLTNFKAYHDEQSKMWNRDSSDLVRVIKILSQNIRDKEQKTLELLKDIDRDVNWMRSTSNQCVDSPKEICFSPPSDKSPLKATQTPPTNNNPEYRSSPNEAYFAQKGAKSSERVEKGEIFSGNRNELNRDDVIMGSNLYSPPQLFGTNKKYQDNINPFLTPQNEVLDLNMKKAQQYRNNVNTISTDHTKQSASLSSAFNSMLSNFQNKIQKHIADINECALNQQVKLDTEVNNTLKNMGSFTNPKDIEKKLELSFGFTEKKINQAKLQKKNEKNSKIFNIINNNVSSEISMRKDFESFVKDGSRVDCSYIMEKMKNNPTKPQFEGSNINENILKKLEILQNSLSLSEREAVICMLMEDLDHNSKQHNVNFEDLMAVPHPNDKISSIISNNMYPRSISKVRDQSANSVFRCEVSHIKGSYHPQSESIAQSPHHIEPVFSPEFYSKKKPENRNLQQIITTPNAEKADLFHYLSRYVSPQPGVEVDINIQNMDLGSFIVNHEDIPHKDFETPGMKGLMEKLGKDVISPIVAKEKVGNVVREINQGKYVFPTSVEKEYGRKIGGALDFNDKFLMEFDSKSTDEDRVNTSEERKRLPTAEDTKYVEKGDDLDLQHPIYQVLGKDIEKEGKREIEERQKPKGSENRFIRMFPFKICGANKNGK